MTARRGSWALATAGVVLLLAGCGTATGSAVAQPTPGRATSCTGLPPRVPTGRLPPGVHVVGALLCRQETRVLPGRGEWQVRVEQRPAEELLGQLDAVLHEPDRPEPRDVPCTANLIAPPDLQVDLADGTITRPAVPRDGCGQPRADVLALLARLAGAPGAPGVQVVPLAQQLSAPAGAAGCSAAWTDAVTGSGHGGAAGPPLPSFSAFEHVGVCAYERRAGRFTLVRSGVAQGLGLERLPVTARPDRPCPAVAAGALGVDLGPGGDQPLLWVETGGCGPVVGPDLRASGYLPAAVVARLAALATAPEPGT